MVESNFTSISVEWPISQVPDASYVLYWSPRKEELGSGEETTPPDFIKVNPGQSKATLTYVLQFFELASVTVYSSEVVLLFGCTQVVVHLDSLHFCSNSFYESSYFRRFHHLQLHSPFSIAQIQCLNFATPRPNLLFQITYFSSLLVRPFILYFHLK